MNERGLASSRAVYVVLALVVLLGVVAVASRGHESPVGGGGHARAPVQILFDVVFTLTIVGGAAMVVFLAFLRAKTARKRREASFRHMIMILIVVAAVSLTAVALAERIGETGGNASSAASEQLRAAGESTFERAQEPEFHWTVGLGTLALLLAALAAVIAHERRRRRAGVREQQLAEQLADVLEDTLDDLRAEPDARRAVIAAYARMERALAAHGLPRRESDAPLEYLVRVLVDLDVDERAARRLTELFTVAKFSDRSVDERMKKQAIEALEAIRDDLRLVQSQQAPVLALDGAEAAR